MSSSEPSDGDELENVELGVIKTSVGGASSNPENVSTNLSIGERQAIVGMLSQHLGAEDERGVSVGGDLKEDMVGPNGNLKIIRYFAERRENAEDEEEEEAIFEEFKESARQIAIDLDERIQRVSSDINESQVYIVSAKVDGLVEGEDRYVASVIKMKTYNAMGIDRNEGGEEEAEGDRDPNVDRSDATFVPEIDQLDKVLIYPHITGNERCLFAPFHSGDNSVEQENVERIVKFYQRGSRSKYFEDLVANKIRPNSKEQLKKAFNALDSIKETGDLSPNEFDQLFGENDCVTAANLITVAGTFSNVSSDDEARDQLDEQLSRPSLDAVSAEASSDKKPGKMKHTFKGRNSGEKAAIKYESSMEGEVEILPDIEPDNIVVKIEGEMDEVEIVDN